MEDNRRLKHKISELSKKDKEPIVSEYLKNYYKNNQKDQDIVVSGVTYKTLKRREVTTFYDVNGNTLFDVENQRLDEEYELLMKDNIKTDDNTIGVPVSDTVENAKQGAKEKLTKELKESKDKTFVEPIISYLLKRCADDEGLALDVLQEHKTWDKCYSYIYSKARGQAKGNCVAVRDDMVYEWAEDYYHKDDKAEEEKKAKEAENLKKHRTEAAKKASAKTLTKAPVTAEPKKQEEPKPKKNSKDMDGQLDLFSMMGM